MQVRLWRLPQCAKAAAFHGAHPNLAAGGVEVVLVQGTCSVPLKYIAPWTPKDPKVSIEEMSDVFIRFDPQSKANPNICEGAFLDGGAVPSVSFPPITVSVVAACLRVEIGPICG